MDYQAWRCCRDMSLFCPDEGCPVSYGCARNKGWQPGMPSPAECQGMPALENMLSHKNYNPREVGLARLIAVIHSQSILTEAQIMRVTDLGRIEVRTMIDDGMDMLRNRPMEGMWGKSVMRRLEP